MLLIVQNRLNCFTMNHLHEQTQLVIRSLKKKNIRRLNLTQKLQDFDRYFKNVHTFGNLKQKNFDLGRF